MLKTSVTLDGEIRELERSLIEHQQEYPTKSRGPNRAFLPEESRRFIHVMQATLNRLKLIKAQSTTEQTKLF